MNKNEFLTLLRRRLSALPGEDIEKSLEYYREMIDDRIEDGLSEEEAVAAVGSIDDIVSQIMAASSLQVKAPAAPKGSRSRAVWATILIVIGSPLWLSLIAVLLSVYICVWAVVASVYAVVLSLALAAVVGIIGSVIRLPIYPAVDTAMLLGIGLIAAGLSVFLFFASNMLAKWTFIIGKKIAISIKNCFIKKETSNETL